jgi:TolB-like protein/DNA-binding winged helix-turn-helix (wHTH) protein
MQRVEGSELTVASSSAQMTVIDCAEREFGGMTEMGDVPLRTTVRFGIFEADFRSGELRKRGIKIKLHQQPLRVLQILLEHPGEVISKDELQKRIWQGETFVDFDHGLYSAIKKLREALCDDADEPRYVETLPKRGYRFIGQLIPDEPAVEPADADDGFAAATEILPRPSPGVGVIYRKYKVAGTALGTLGLFFALLILLNLRGVRDWMVGRHKLTVIRSLAVLPLENLSDDPAQKYFSYGMTEELTTDLAKISGLKVISHTSTMRYEDQSKLPSLQEISRELGVDGIVEGAVQRSGNQVRITIQLIYAPDDKHLWAETYDRDFKDVLVLQSNVAAAIVAKIRTQTTEAKPVPIPTTPATPNLEALEAYLQGNYSLRRMGAGEGVAGYRSAITFFKQAIASDPNFGLAYLGLAQTYDAGFEWRPNEIMPLEKAALAKALELDPGSADAHLMSA